MNPQAIADLLFGPILRVDIEAVVARATNQHEGDIVSANQEQLQQGQLATGRPVTPFYKPSTVKQKKKKGQPADKVTLKDKNTFYQGFYAKASGRTIEQGSTAPQTPYLLNRYTDSIFGLSVASQSEVADRLRPTLQTEFRSAVFR